MFGRVHCSTTFNPKKYQVCVQGLAKDLKKSAEVRNFEYFLYFQHILRGIFMTKKHLELNAVLHSSEDVWEINLIDELTKDLEAL